jgi:hypothetical protein
MVHKTILNCGAEFKKIVLAEGVGGGRPKGVCLFEPYHLFFFVGVPACCELRAPYPDMNFGGAPLLLGWQEIFSFQLHLNNKGGAMGIDERRVIASYQWINEAQMARIHLECHGVVAEVVDSEIAAANPLYANAVGGIKLTVPAQDAPEAEKILKEYEKQNAENHKAWCPECESENVKTIEVHRVLKFLSVMTFGLAALVMAKSFRCGDCGYKWR